MRLVVHNVTDLFVDILHRSTFARSGDVVHAHLHRLVAFGVNPGFVIVCLWANSKDVSRNCWVEQGSGETLPRLAKYHPVLLLSRGHQIA